MMNSRNLVESLSPSELRSATQQLVRRSHGLDAALLVHLGEIEERKLYLDWSFPSMFAYCVGELGFSEDVACNRINVARAARRAPIILEALRAGKVHLAGLRLLAPHLTVENQEQVLLREAQDLLRHRIPDGDLAMIFEKALRVLVEQVKKERFAAGRKPRETPAESPETSSSRHVPDAIKREVYERDGGRCTFTAEDGRRCGETGALEFDHLDGFARTRVHRADRIRLLCRAHNQRAAEQMYGRAFMERARASGDLFAADRTVGSG